MKTKLIAAALVLLLALFVMFCISSCTSTKKVNTTTQTVDSTVYHERDSIVAEKNAMQTRHEKELKDAKKTSVVFKDVPCPTAVNTGSDCQYDSLVNAIRQRDNYISQMKNTIKVNKDGSYQIEGQLTQANIELETMDRTVTDLAITNERITHVNDSLAAELKKKDSTKVLNKKTKVLANWWLYALCFVGGCFFWQRFGIKVKSLFITKK